MAGYWAMRVLAAKGDIRVSMVKDKDDEGNETGIVKLLLENLNPAARGSLMYEIEDLDRLICCLNDLKIRLEDSDDRRIQAT